MQQTTAGYAGVTSTLCWLLFNVFMLWALSLTQVNTVVITSSVLPILVTVLSIFFLKEKLHWRSAVGVILAVSGMLLMQTQQPHAMHTNMHGSLIVLLALLPEAGYYILSKRFPSSLPFAYTTLFIHIFNAAAFLCLLLYTHTSFVLHFNTRHWLEMCIISSTTVLFFFFWQNATQRCQASQLAISAAMLPLISICLSGVLLHEALLRGEMLGMTCVIAAIVLNTLRKKTCDLDTTPQKKKTT